VGLNLFKFDGRGEYACYGISEECLDRIEDLFLSLDYGNLALHVAWASYSTNKNISRSIEAKIETLCGVGKCDVAPTLDVESAFSWMPGNARGCAIFAYSVNTLLSVPVRVLAVCLRNSGAPHERLKTNRENGWCVDVSIICF